MERTKKATTLHKLTDLNLKVADSAEDIRGHKVVDTSGEEIGKVDDLLVDGVDRKVRFLLVASGGFLGLGETTFLLPVDAITGIGDGVVRVDQTRERIAGAPRYSPDLIANEKHWNELYGYYGYSPFWSEGYNYPPYPRYRR
jgi:sporulation protein YlmC with PRC-barrel domain